MGIKNIQGDLNITGNILQSNTKIAPVIANPEIESGDEPQALSSLQIGDNKYTIESTGVSAGQLFNEFSTSSTYFIGDLVTYDNKFYICKTKITTAGAWDSSNWLETKPVMQYLNLNPTASSGHLSADEYALAQSSLCLVKRDVLVYHQDRVYDGGSLYTRAYGASGWENFGSIAIRSDLMWFYNELSNVSVQSINPNDSATNNLQKLKLNNSVYNLTASGVLPITTAPTADNTDGDVKIVILSSQPAQRYQGYLYFITGSN